MARIQRKYLVKQDYYQSTAVGASDAQTLMNILAPCAGARIIRFDATLATSVADTGTFTVILEEQGGTDLTAAATIDADAATNTTVQAKGNGTAVSADGVQLAFVTVKTGTVATGNKLWLNILWQL